MAPSSYFVYRSLTPMKKRIRLLHILPQLGYATKDSTSSDTISCTISHSCLEDNPSYVALSYTWGDSTRSSPIQLNGSEAHVTSNLETALRHIRSDDVPITIWIDALCIDQHDHVEKSEQVQQMKEIYASASSVITWLGPSMNDSDLAIQWIQKYGDWAFRLSIGEKPELRLRHLLESLDRNGKGHLNADLETFLEEIRSQLSAPANAPGQVVTALSKLFQRPYWSRVWVVQEMARGRNMRFQCGYESTNEPCVHHATRLMRNFRHYLSLKQGKRAHAAEQEQLPILSVDMRNPVNIFKIRRAGGALPLIYLLRLCSHFKSTDVRDKIFALLGIASDAQDLGIRPDYSKSSDQVYTETAEKLILAGYTEILSLSGLSDSTESLPSWVPDSSRKRLRAPLQQRGLDRIEGEMRTFLQPQYAAGVRDSRPSVEFDRDAKGRPTMSIPAVFLGEVEDVGPPWVTDGVGAWLHHLEQLSQTSSRDENSSDERMRAVWRTAVADQNVRQGTTKPRFSDESIEGINAKLNGKNLMELTPDSVADFGLGDYCFQMQEKARHRRPLRVAGSRLGVGPEDARAGDLAYVLVGADVPFVLRRSLADSSLRLLGETYIHGVMDGEVMEKGPIIETITIS